MSIIYNGVELPYLYYNGQPTSGYYNGVCVWPTSQPTQNGWYMKHFDDSNELESYITNKNNGVFPYDWSMDLHTTMNYTTSSIGYRPDLAKITYTLSSCVVDSIAYTATASTWSGTITASFASFKMFDNNVSFIYSANQVNNNMSWADTLEPYYGQLQWLLGGLSNSWTADTNIQYSDTIYAMQNSYRNDSTAKFFNNTASYNGTKATDDAYNNMQINQGCGTEQSNFPSVSSVIGNTYFVLRYSAWQDNIQGKTIQVTANTADIDEVKNRLDNFAFSSHLVPTWTFTGSNNGYFAFNASVYPSAQGESVIPIV